MNLEIFLLPFMQRALVGGILVAILASTVGIFAVLRKNSFFGDTIAHASLTGVAIGLLLGWNPFITALVFALVLSVVLPKLQQSSQLNIDAILGFALPFSMALGILILTGIPGYKPELISLLFGSILSTSWTQLIYIILLSLFSFIIIVYFYPKLLATAIDPLYAHITGISVATFAVLHNVLLSLAIIPSISLVGIVLVTALLIIPAASARQLVTSLKSMFILTPIIAVIATLIGMVLSVIFNLPSGPMIVVVLGSFFIVISLGKRRAMMWSR